MLQLDKKIRKAVALLGITPTSPMFKTMLQIRDRYVTPMRERYGRVRVWWKSRREKPINPHSRSELDAFLTAFGQPPLETVSTLVAASASDPVMAERLVLALLVDRPDLRERFPQALHRGPDGPYATWLAGPGAIELGLQPQAIENIKKAFQRHPGAHARKLYDHHNGLRERIPHALTAPYWAAFAEWLIRSGMPVHSIKVEDVIWFLVEAGEDPSFGIIDSWLRSRDWQKRWPDALKPGGCKKMERELPKLEIGFHKLRDRWNLDPAAQIRPLDTVRKLEGNAPSDGKGPGINIIGHFCYPSGLREAAVQMGRALVRAGGGISLRDFPASVEADLAVRDQYMGTEAWPVTACVLSPDQTLGEISWWSGLDMPTGRDRVAVWYWELEEVPPAWVPRAREFTELWAPTRFIADAMRKTLDVPVIDLLPGVELEPVTPLPRSHFGLPEGEFLFLFMFDMCSIFERKNPMAVIAAFERAFPREANSTRPRLVIKVNRGSFNPEGLNSLRTGLERIGGILLDGTYTRNEAYALMNCADAYVSLHRSEGFGLTMAEAMLMDKPVIATGYSGNMDFMNDQTALLIPHGMIDIDETRLVYRKGMRWADPSVEHAAKAMRSILEKPNEAREMANRAKAHIQKVLSLEAAGKRFLERARILAEKKHFTKKVA